jgi:uncharacterized protein (DUF1800 family)
MNRRQIAFAALAVTLFATGVYAKKRPATSAADEQKRALHALDRLTFGPRPGDVPAVAAMGVDKWIDLQLHPDKIDDSAMQARLAPYRTLQMSTRAIVFNFPPNPVAKAVMDGKLPMPGDPYRHAIYTAAIDRVEQNQEQKQNAATAQNLPATNVQPAGLSERQTAKHETHSVADDLILLPPDARINRILTLLVAQQHDLLQGISYPKRQALLAGLNPEQRETVIALNHPEAVVDSELQSAKLLRAVYSDRQLEEVLTDFWFNHFNVFLGKGPDRYLVTAYERDVIRPHVLGKFKDLLLATAQSPAMLFYLDNWQSEGPDSDAALGRPVRAKGAQPPPYGASRPGGMVPAQQRAQHPNPQNNAQKRSSGLNENYARELMELHTLGVNGGYTQHDVTEVARVFTGWTLEQPQQGGDFIFLPRLHEPGDKMVLGHRIQQDGEDEGVQVLNLLAHQPATARFISTELAQRFVSDRPPQSLIDAMSKTFLKTDGDLREVLRTMFRSPEFWAPDTYRARVKTPFEFVASSLRATQAGVSDPQPLLAALNKMGEPLYNSQPPTGYSTQADVWVNSAALLDRMNFGLALATNKLPGTSFNLAQLMNSGTSTLVAAKGNPGTSANAAPVSPGMADPYQVELKLEQTLLSGDVSRQTHDTIEQHIVGPELTAGPDSKQAPNVNVIAGLLLGSPEFQRK